MVVLDPIHSRTAAGYDPRHSDRRFIQHHQTLSGTRPPYESDEASTRHPRDGAQGIREVTAREPGRQKRNVVTSEYLLLAAECQSAASTVSCLLTWRWAVPAVGGMSPHILSASSRIFPLTLSAVSPQCLCSCVRYCFRPHSPKLCLLPGFFLCAGLPPILPACKVHVECCLRPYLHNLQVRMFDPRHENCLRPYPLHLHGVLDPWPLVVCIAASHSTQLFPALSLNCFRPWSLNVHAFVFDPGLLRTCRACAVQVRHCLRP